MTFLDETTEHIDVDFYEMKHETPQAKLFDFGTGEDVWIPTSQIEYEDSETIRIPMWLAEEKGLV